MCERLITERLLLRQWKDEDRRIFAAINSDPEVMRYFPRTFTIRESDAFVDFNTECIAKQGWGSWAVENINTGEFIGYVGFAYPADWHPCAGQLEIGWRLARRHWGRGYATEAAAFALGVGFDAFAFEQVISFTAVCNLPSVNVMKKIGMHQDNVGFRHPRIDTDSPLCEHVVYRLDRAEWQNVPAGNLKSEPGIAHRDENTGG